MLQQLNVVGESCESTLVLKKKADILSISYSISIYQFQFISDIVVTDATTAKRMKIGQYCQRQCCKHVELEQFLAGFRVARVCQR